MDYKEKFIEGISIEEINKELKIMDEMHYRHGRSIDRPRKWDLLYTRKMLNIKKLEEGEKLYCVWIKGRANSLYINLRGSWLRTENVFAKSHKEAKEIVWNHFLDDLTQSYITRKDVSITSEDMSEFVAGGECEGVIRKDSLYQML